VKKLGFVYPEGPAQPQPERDVVVAGRKGRGKKRAEGPSEPDEDGGETKTAPEPQAT
jgi:ATP-dependent Clp protease ATP-binding subunit ClpA